MRIDDAAINNNQIQSVHIIQATAIKLICVTSVKTKSTFGLQ